MKRQRPNRLGVLFFVCESLSQLIKTFSLKYTPNSLPFDPATISTEKAELYFSELLELVDGRSGLFSNSGPKKR